MAVAAYPATLKISTTVVLDIMHHELTLKMGNVETTAFSGSGGAAVGTKTFVPTLLEMQAKIIGSWNKADTNGQLVIETAFFSRTLTTFIFSPNVTTTYTVSASIIDYINKTDPTCNGDS